jgi:hypothetical protein
MVGKSMHKKKKDLPKSAKSLMFFVAPRRFPSASLWASSLLPNRLRNGMSWTRLKKKELTHTSRLPQKKRWRPQGDLNPCRRRERPVSWTRLDDGDAMEETNSLYVATVGAFAPELVLMSNLVGRAGVEPTTNGLKVRCSTI